VGRRRADDGNRERPRRIAARRDGRHRRARDGGTARGIAGPGRPTEIEYAPSFVDGAGGRALLPTMWERARELVDEAVAVPLDEVREAMRLLATRAGLVAEGAGALALAVALRRDDRCVCIVSGHNVDLDVYARIVAN